MYSEDVHRMRRVDFRTNPEEGIVVWSPIKSLWWTSHTFIALAVCPATISIEAVGLSFFATVITLCMGHSVGLHRLLIHRSFRCPVWLECLLVHLGTVVGMGGPLKMIEMHDIRDWAQRQPACHPYLTNRPPMWRDWLWQLHCELRLVHPPEFVLEPSVEKSRLFRFMQKTWMLQQLPWAILFYYWGGTTFLCWGVSLRISISLLGHWIVGFFAHNFGERDWHLQGHSVQGYNLPALSLLTMGESWHNNHHAFPGSARLGLTPAQLDPGWWFILCLSKIGLAWDVQIPALLPHRAELSRLAPLRARTVSET